MPSRSYSLSSGPWVTIVLPRPAVWVSRLRTVIGRVAGRLSRLVSGWRSTFMFLKPGKKSLIGWSSFSFPSSIRLIAAIAVIGLVIEYTRHRLSGPAGGAVAPSASRPAATKTASTEEQHSEVHDVN